MSKKQKYLSTGNFNSGENKAVKTNSALKEPIHVMKKNERLKLRHTVDGTYGIPSYR